MKIPQNISVKLLKKIALIIAGVFLLVLLFLCFEFYVPANPSSHETIVFAVEKGWGDEQVAVNLKKAGIIRSSYFFRLYVVLSLKHTILQAGEYNLSPRMSIHRIANKMMQGDIIKDTVVILEGWDINDIGKYLESKNICTQDNFVAIAGEDYSLKFDFLKDMPGDLSLEGYLFPDTYQISKNETCENIINYMLENFEKKLTQDLEDEIIRQNKSIFEIITMASIIEKEARGLSDKKIVSGIFWKRIKAGMALQSCATVNYITGKNDPGISLKDMQIDSPYNTYKYKGLPKGPISNPGLDSIIAAIYPQASDYWYFLSNGRTIFSKTLEEHNAAKAR